MSHHLWVLGSSHSAQSGEVGVGWGSSHLAGGATRARVVPWYRLLELKVSHRGSCPGGRSDELRRCLCSAPKPTLLLGGSQNPLRKMVLFFCRKQPGLSVSWVGPGHTHLSRAFTGSADSLSRWLNKEQAYFSQSPALQG